MAHPKKQDQILLKHFGERLVGGRLSQMANYADLFEKTRDCIFLISFDTHEILECNPVVPKTFGLTMDDVLGKNFLDWVIDENRDQMISLLGSLSSSPTQPEPFDIKLKDTPHTFKIFEIVSCRLKLADYCEVIQLIAKDVDAARAYEKHLKTLSNTDPMTGLSNFRSFQNELELEHERAVRYETLYSVLFFDVDHFKHYNDLNGHPAGDQTLRRVAHVLSKNSRRSDLVARYGGEEFVVLARGADAKQAQLYGEKLRRAIERENFPNGEKQPLGRVSVSVGTATFPTHGQDPKKVIESADQALYQSKKQGRNRVTSASKRKAA